MSNTTLPAPLTPADCDLRDFPFMLLDVKRLRDSDMALTETPEACWAALLLWCASWHQVPAGSLSDDDRVLANLAGYGRVVKEWRKHKAGALHGWVKCSDGRLYHKTVAEKANAAWESKLQQRWKTECARIKKHNERNKTTYPLPQYEEWLAAGRPMGYPIASDSPELKTDVPSDNQDCPDAVHNDTASKGEGEGEGEGYKNTPQPPESGGAVAQELFSFFPEQRRTRLAEVSALIGELVSTGTVTPDQLLAAAAQQAAVLGKDNGKACPSVLRWLRDQRWLDSGIYAPTGSGSAWHGLPPNWMETRSGVESMGRLLGLGEWDQQADRLFSSYENRVVQALQTRGKAPACSA